MDSLKRLLQLPGVVSSPPAAPAEIQVFSSASTVPSLDEIAGIYSVCNGALLSGQVLRILSLADCLLYLDGMRNIGIPQRWGYLPIVDNNDSNHWCVCRAEPLRGYVVQVYHDDSAQIKFRCLDNFFTAMRRQLEADDPFLDDVSCDFDDPARTVRDVETARTLIQAESGINDVERCDALRFAITLFSNREIDEIILLLDDRDEYVREAVVKRLRRIDTPEANRAIQQFHEAVRSFVAGCAELLGRNGIRASIHDQTKLRLDDGPVWLNLNMLFGERREASFNTFLIERATELLAMKQNRKTR